MLGGTPQGLLFPEKHTFLDFGDMPLSWKVSDLLKCCWISQHVYEMRTKSRKGTDQKDGQGFHETPNAIRRQSGRPNQTKKATRGIGKCRLQMRDIWTLRPRLYTEFRYKSEPWNKLNDVFMFPCRCETRNITNMFRTVKLLETYTNLLNDTKIVALARWPTD